MFCWSSRLALALCLPAYGHVVSVSHGELHINGRSATYELRIPAYEVPEGADVLKEMRFGSATLASSQCWLEGEWYTCRAVYELPEPAPETLEVECRLYRVTAPNHVHILYASNGANADQRVFDQTSPVIELRFHPPSPWESVAREGTAGARRLLDSFAGVLFLAVIALAARSQGEAALLAAGFIGGECTARWASLLFAIPLSPEFLEAAAALTTAYLAGELLLLPDSRARWMLVPLFGLIHGLPFAADPGLFLAGAAVVQLTVIAACYAVTLRVPPGWRKPASTALLLCAITWFVRLVAG